MLKENLKVSNSEKMAILETLTLRLKAAGLESIRAANDLIIKIEKSNGQLKRALKK